MGTHMDARMDAEFRNRIAAVTTDGNPDQMYTAAEVASLLRISVRRVGDLRRRGDIPCVFITPRVVRFKSSDIRAFIQERAR